MAPRKGYTARGFRRIEFTDANGVVCSLQKSSSAERDCIWFGCNDIDLKRLDQTAGWISVPLDPNDHVANTRMHLTQAHVKKLLPMLTAFVNTGDL